MDDSPYNLFVMKEIMNTIVRRDGSIYDIHTAINGQDALNQIMQGINSRRDNDGSSKMFDIIFLDLQMPVLDGF